MAYPFDHCRNRPTTPAWTANLDPAEWRCIECGKLLGVRHGARLHIRLQRHSYVVTLPAEAICPACAAENRT